MKSKEQTFCYLQHYCSCSNHELMKLDPNKMRRYEREGYPLFINGHQFKGVSHSLKSNELNRQKHLGKHPTPETLKKMSESQSGENNHFFNKKHKLKTKEKMRINHADVSGKKNVNYGKQMNNDKKIYYHNTPFQGLILFHRWDRKYAQYLDLNNIKYYYEYKAFELVLNNKYTTYTPDFYLPNTNEYIEIKGWWRRNSKEKFLKFKEIYKDIKITLLMEEDLINSGIDLKVSKEEKEILNKNK